MKDRTLQILTALIEDFVETAMPVASKRLLESSHFNVSSATIRNEFALLEEVGLIESPHVSAGKVPTEKGYRFFVDELMQDEKQDLLVHNLFEKHVAEYRFQRAKESVFDAIRILSSLSGNAAFAVINNDRTLYVGISNVLRSPEFLHAPEKAAQVLEILEGQKRFSELLHSLDLPNNQVKIFIGEENLLEEINSCAMLVSKFETQDASGYLGIIGPTRMKYGFNKALIRNVLGMI